MGISHSSQPVDERSGSTQAALDLDGMQLLLVEDCVDQGRLYLEILKLAGAEVTLECNGKSAVKAVKKSPTLFHAVVMDFQMPEMDGLESTRQLREFGYSGAIIAVSAFGSENLKLSWFQAGCNEFLLKPLNRRELISAVLQHTQVGMNAVL